MNPNVLLGLRQSFFSTPLARLSREGWHFAIYNTFDPRDTRARHADTLALCCGTVRPIRDSELMHFKSPRRCTPLPEPGGHPRTAGTELAGTVAAEARPCCSRPRERFNPGGRTPSRPKTQRNWIAARPGRCHREGAREEPSSCRPDSCATPFLLRQAGSAAPQPPKYVQEQPGRRFQGRPRTGRKADSQTVHQRPACVRTAARRAAVPSMRRARSPSLETWSGGRRSVEPAQSLHSPANPSLSPERAKYRRSRLDRKGGPNRSPTPTRPAGSGTTPDGKLFAVRQRRGSESASAGRLRAPKPHDRTHRKVG